MGRGWGNFQQEIYSPELLESNITLDFFTSDVSPWIPITASNNRSELYFPETT